MFGNIHLKAMHANAAGKMIIDCWQAIPKHYPGIRIDEFQLMPDHFHGIVIIDHDANKSPQLSLSDVIHRFKTITTHQYCVGVKDKAWPAFTKKLWQRGYHDRIIRQESEYCRIRDYIIDNPRKWLGG